MPKHFRVGDEVRWRGNNARVIKASEQYVTVEGGDGHTKFTADACAPFDEIEPLYGATPFRVGDRVRWKSRNAQGEGLVVEANDSEIRVQRDGDDTMLRLPVDTTYVRRVVKVGHDPFPKLSGNTFRAGDRVRWNYEGKPQAGEVLRVSHDGFQAKRDDGRLFWVSFSRSSPEKIEPDAATSGHANVDNPFGYGNSAPLEPGDWVTWTAEGEVRTGTINGWCGIGNVAVQPFGNLELKPHVVPLDDCIHGKAPDDERFKVGDKVCWRQGDEYPSGKIFQFQGTDALIDFDNNAPFLERVRINKLQRPNDHEYTAARRIATPPNEVGTSGQYYADLSPAEVKQQIKEAMTPPEPEKSNKTELEQLADEHPTLPRYRFKLGDRVKWTPNGHATQTTHGIFLFTDGTLTAVWCDEGKMAFTSLMYLSALALAEERLETRLIPGQRVRWQDGLAQREGRFIYQSRDEGHLAAVWCPQKEEVAFVAPKDLKPLHEAPNAGKGPSSPAVKTGEPLTERHSTPLPSMLEPRPYHSFETFQARRDYVWVAAVIASRIHAPGQCCFQLNVFIKLTAWSEAQAAAALADHPHVVRVSDNLWSVSIPDTSEEGLRDY